jgi:phosphatidate cytidylyltransferase
MTRLLSGAVLIALTIWCVWFAPAALFELTAFVLLFFAVGEIVSMLGAGGVAVPLWSAIVGASLTLAAFTGTIGRHQVPLDIVLMVELVGLGLVALSAWQSGSPALVTMAAVLFPSLYPTLSIGSMVAIREAAGAAALLLLIATVVASDTAQYYTGRAVGRRPLAKTISPKKTIEGAAGGFVCGAAVFVFVGAWWLPQVPTGVRVLVGAGIVAAGIAGDLFQSMLKRSVGVKDSSGLIPGHGGILDRIDALLFAAPFYYIVLKYV